MSRRKSGMNDEDNVVEFPGDLDPAQFRISGTDTRGHTQRIWANLQPMHAQTIDVLAQCGKFPYRNRGDLVRHALIRHLHWLERIHKPINSVTGALDAMNALLRENEFHLEMREFFNALAKQIDDLMKHQEQPAARRLLLRTIRSIEGMPDSYWKDRYLTTLQTQHRDLLATMPKASLLDFGDAVEEAGNDA